MLGLCVGFPYLFVKTSLIRIFNEVTKLKRTKLVGNADDFKNLILIVNQESMHK
jgi:hypothetical protein